MQKTNWGGKMPWCIPDEADNLQRWLQDARHEPAEICEMCFCNLWEYLVETWDNCPTTYIIAYEDYYAELLPYALDYATGYEASPPEDPLGW